MRRAPKEAERAEGGIEECAANVVAKLVFHNEWKAVASGLGRTACCLELGKKGDCGSGRLPGKMWEALERLMEPEEVERFV